MIDLNRTHDASRKSWVESANSPETDFPLQNLPFGIFSRAGGPSRVGVAIGDRALDVSGCVRNGRLRGDAAEACRDAGSLNPLMSLAPDKLSELRAQIFDLLDADGDGRGGAQQFLEPRGEIQMHLPAVIGDYTDFYASIHHATRVGLMFRPDNPLMPNYKYLPVGYHGRASSVVVDGTPVRRPRGEVSATPLGPPEYKPCRLLDYELEVGAFVRGGNALGETLPVAAAGEQIFGLCLLNDWSARDIQSWEYQPLGPFLAKSFATTISPWVVTAEALAPFRVAASPRPEGDPAPLPHLADVQDAAHGGFAIQLSVELRTPSGVETRLSASSFRDMYWTVAQMITHHASNGCNLRAGDLLGSGTVSGAAREEAGCLLELTQRGKEPIALADGSTRAFLQDGDEITLRGRCEREGFASIGFGKCSGQVLPAE